MSKWPTIIVTTFCGLVDTFMMLKYNAKVLAAKEILTYLLI